MPSSPAVAVRLHHGYFMRHHLALTALIALASASLADAAPRRRVKVTKKKIAADLDLIELEGEPRRPANAKKTKVDIDVEDDEAPRKATKKTKVDIQDVLDKDAPTRPTKATKKPKVEIDVDDEEEVHAASRRLAKATKKPKVIDVDDEVDDEDDGRVHLAKKPTKSARDVVDDEVDDAEADDHTERVALRDEDAVDEVEAPVRVRKPAKRARSKDWHIAVGPYLWASSVDADVSLGSATVSTGVDFLDIQRHAKYGAEVLAEARYGRFAIYGDFMYGVVGVAGEREVGPFMVKLDGEASSLLVDGVAGYRLAGGEQSLLSLEARAGVRYQRTAISGSVNVAGTDVAPTAHVDAAADALAGAHAVLRPCNRFALSGTLDLGVFGDSDRTWAAAADATFRITKHVRASLGWRTLTTERTNVSIVMHGPRAAVQLVF